MRLPHLLFLAAGASLLIPATASATYSPPLTRVRIDKNKSRHTPSLVYASERRTTAATDLELTGWGVQYLGQLEWEAGFGLQVGAAVGYAGVEGDVGIVNRAGIGVDTDGFWTGGQLRAYYMLYKSKVDEAVERPSAVTAFVNLRGLYYDTSSDEGEQADLRFFTLTGGVGAMAEFSLSKYISICPYAWLTPGVTSRLDYRVRGQDFAADFGLTLKNPLLVGIDLWVYLFPPNWGDHLSLSVITSLFDDNEDDQTIATVIGYTF